MWYNSKTNELQSEPPWGNGYLHPDVIAEQYADWQQISDDFVPPISIEELRAEQWQKIKAIRDKKEESGFPYLGKTLDSDPISVQRIAIAVQAAQAAISANQAFTLDWTCADNSVLAMTAEQVVGMSVALAQYSNSLHETARQLRQQIDAATTADQVSAITWPEG